MSEGTSTYQQIVLRSRDFPPRERSEITRRALFLLSQGNASALDRLYATITGHPPVAGYGVPTSHSSTYVEEVQGRYLIYPQDQARYFSNYQCPLNQQKPIIAHSYPLYSNFGVPQPKPNHW